MSKPTSDCRVTERKHPWPMVRLGDVCRVVLGGTPKTGIPEYWDGDIPWLTPGDMGKIAQMYVDASNCKRKITQLGLDSGSTLCPARSVILSTRAPIGYVFVNSVPMATNQGCKTLVPSDDVYPEYLCFNLLGRTDELNELGTGTTFKELATGNLKAMTLPLPPLSEQKEIVARLERELATVEKMKKDFEALAETAKAEFKAELKEVFEEISRGGAETRRLGDVCELIPGFAFKSKEFGDFNNRVIRIGNINPPSIAFSDGIGVNIQAYSQERLSKYVAIEGDCLVAMTGATIGKMGVMGVGRAYVNQRVLIIRARSMLSQMYLANLLLSASFREFTEINADSKAAQPNISAGTIGSYAIPLPPISTQREVVARLDVAKARAEKLEAKAREGVAVCETMRKAILKEAFAPCGAGEVA